MVERDGKWWREMSRDKERWRKLKVMEKDEGETGGMREE